MLRERRSREPVQARTVALAAVAIATILLAVVFVAVLWRSSEHGSSAARSLVVPASGPASKFEGAALPANITAPPFTLRDQQGRNVSLAQYRGHVVVLTFLDPTCGAPCVLIAQQIRGALDELPTPVPVLIVSADPASDSPARVRRFLSEGALAGRAQYLSGTPAQLRDLWTTYSVRPASAGKRVFGEYAFVMLIDPSGRERVVFESEQLTPESLSHDIQLLEGDHTHP
jgi:protein SCO1/2